MNSIIIRTATNNDINAIASVHLEGWQSTYKNIINQPYLDNLSYATYHTKWHDILSAPKPKTVYLVAVNKDNAVIGFIAAGPTHTDLGYDAEIYALYLLPSYQGQGIGKRLLLQSAQQLQHHGLQSLYVCVLENNPAKNFYEKLGGQKLDLQEQVQFNEQVLTEIFYGWKNIDTLITKK